jgi:hypothetical protein
VVYEYIYYFMVAYGQCKRERNGKGDKNNGEHATMSSDVGSKRGGSGRVATNQVKILNFHFYNTD